ncbi:uncharacterized protein LOC127243805 [Andrographis paniculata]|uniref:uncharacterized protein LOC127243805 n=1 Tax=Andrographis paniculata TaxID=175694 RepID=UPI0021E77044|nr:uncharacterized protein LOC127243805 [Andrographis paniculata]
MKMTMKLNKVLVAQLSFFFLIIYLCTVIPPASAQQPANSKHPVNSRSHYPQDIPHENKFTHGTNPRAKPASTKGGGRSRSPYVQGGAGVIPFYAAAAGHGRHTHHNKGSSCKTRLVATALLSMSTLARLVCTRLHA